MKKVISVSLFTPVVLTILCASVFGQSASRTDALKEIETKRAELQELEKQFLAPAEEDRALYAEFLKQQNTGLIRLLPREVYDSETYRKNLKSLTMRGGGSYYSFTRLTHEYGWGSDICLDSGYLKVGFAGADYGMLLEVGDVPIEQVTSESSSAAFISSYHPPTAEPEVRLEARRFQAGATIDEVLYKSSVPVALNTTFLLRSISPDRTDVLVVLRVIRKDSDGSAILVWKLLRTYPKPVLARTK